MYVNLEIDLLRTFVLAAEAGHFAQAASVVGRTPSAVSLQIDRLEGLTGQQLFQRKGRGFILTVAGEQLLVHAKRMLALNDETVAALRPTKQPESVRLGVPEDFARCWLPDILARFAKEMPHATVEVRTEASAALLVSLDRAELDLAVVFGNAHRKKAEIVAALDTSWVGPPEMHSYRPLGPVPLVLFSPPCFFRTIALESLEAAHLLWRIALVSPGLSGQWGAVKAGLGISLRVRDFVPPDLITLGEANGLPALPPAVLTLQRGSAASASANLLSDLLLKKAGTTTTGAAAQTQDPSLQPLG